MSYNPEDEFTLSADLPDNGFDDVSADNLFKLQSENEQLKKSNNFYKLTLIIMAITFFDIAVFTEINPLGSVIIGIFEILGILLYGNHTEYVLVLQLWAELKDIFSKKTQ